MDFLSQAHNQLINDFMQTHPCVALATRAADGETNLAHVFVSVDTSFNLYFISRPENRKIKNILAHEKVALLFSDKETVEQVEFIGTANGLEDMKEITEHLAALQKVVSTYKTEYWIPPVSQIGGEGYMLFQVTPKQVVYRKYSEATSDIGKTVECEVDFGG